MKLALISRRPPYGDIQAAEAVRHALGALSDELGVSLLLVDGGVLLAKKSQDEGLSGYTNLGAAVKDIMEMGGEVLAEKASLREFGLDERDIVDNVKIAGGYEISETVRQADKVMIF